MRGCIEAVEARFPGFRELVFDPQGNPHRFVSFFVNGEEIPRDALDTPVGERDEVAVLSAIAGG